MGSLSNKWQASPPPRQHRLLRTMVASQVLTLAMQQQHGPCFHMQALV
jgi:hypothetical protein